MNVLTDSIRYEFGTWYREGNFMKIKCDSGTMLMLPTGFEYEYTPECFVRYNLSNDSLYAKFKVKGWTHQVIDASESVHALYKVPFSYGIFKGSKGCKEYDSHSAFDLESGRFTLPFDGIVKIELKPVVRVYKDCSVDLMVGVNGHYEHVLSTPVHSLSGSPQMLGYCYSLASKLGQPIRAGDFINIGIRALNGDLEVLNNSLLKIELIPIKTEHVFVKPKSKYQITGIINKSDGSVSGFNREATAEECEVLDKSWGKS